VNTQKPNKRKFGTVASDENEDVDPSRVESPTPPDVSNPKKVSLIGTISSHWSINKIEAVHLQLVQTGASYAVGLCAAYIIFSVENPNLT